MPLTTSGSANGSGTRSRFKGVSYGRRHARCFAQCDFGGRHRWLGFFDTEVEAARAHDYAAVEECGEYARVNFPQEWPPERRREVHAAYQAARKREAKRNTHKGKTKGSKKRAKARRRPRPARRKTDELPQRAPKRCKAR